MDRLLLALSGLLLVTGCWAEQKPLATYRGELTSKTGMVSRKDGADRLSLGWMNFSRAAEKMSTTQEVHFDGHFPVAYEFNVYEEPPEEAMQDNGRGTGRFALGGLIAYRDLNGNEELDSIPQGEGPVDLILGSATVMMIDDADRYFDILYVEGEPPAGLSGARPGFNLIDTGKIVPIETPIPISVDPQARLNLLVCQGVHVGAVSMDDWNACLGPGGPRIFGYMEIEEGETPWASVQVFTDEGEHDDATVTVNGVPMIASPYGNGYQLDPAAASPLVAGGNHTFVATLPDGRSTTLDIRISERPTLLTPAPGATFQKNQSISGSWSPVPGAVFYGLGVAAQIDGRSQRRTRLTQQTSITLPPWQAIAGITEPLSGEISAATAHFRAAPDGSDFSAWNRGAGIPVTFTP